MVDQVEDAVAKGVGAARDVIGNNLKEQAGRFTQSPAGKFFGNLFGIGQGDNQPAARPTGKSLTEAAGGVAEGLRAKASEWTATLSASAASLPAGAAEALKQFRVKPTSEEIAKAVQSGKLDGGLAQKMINAGLVQLPDPKTIGKQAPAPIETRTPVIVEPAKAPTKTPAKEASVEAGPPATTSAATPAVVVSAVPPAAATTTPTTAAFTGAKNPPKTLIYLSTKDLDASGITGDKKVDISGQSRFMEAADALAKGGKLSPYQEKALDDLAKFVGAKDRKELESMIQKPEPVKVAYNAAYDAPALQSP